MALLHFIIGHVLHLAVEPGILHSLLRLFHGIVLHIRHSYLFYAAIDQQGYICILLHHNPRVRVLIHNFTRLFVRVVALVYDEVKIRILFVCGNVFIELSHQVRHFNQIAALVGTVVPIIQEVNGRHSNAHNDGRHQDPLDHHSALGAAPGADQLLLILIIIVIRGRLTAGVVSLHRAGSVVASVVGLQVIPEHQVWVPPELIQVIQHFSRRLKPVHRVFLHGLHGDLFQPPGNGGVDFPGHYGLSLQLHQRNRHRIIRYKRQLAGEHLIEHDANRVDIRLICNIIAAGLLRRNIMHRANRFIRHGLGLALQETGNAKISHLNGSVLQKHDVLRLNIPVDDPLFMGALQCHQDLAGKMHCLLPTDGALLLDILLQGDAINELHDDILNLVAEADIINLHNIGVIEHRNRLGFIAEAAEEIAVVGELFLEDLNGNPAVLHAVIGLIHIGHAPHADQLVDFIPAVKALADKSIHNRYQTFLIGRISQPLYMTAAVMLSAPPHSMAYWISSFARIFPVSPYLSKYSSKSSSSM